MKERYQDLEDKNEALRGYIVAFKERGAEFMQRFEMSWIYHDNALEGTIYPPQELLQALAQAPGPEEASPSPFVLEIRNHRAAIEYIREEARVSGRKETAITLPMIRRIHDLLAGATPEAQAARAQLLRRERSERELAKEKDRSGYRKDMPLHRSYFHEIAQPTKILPLLEKLTELTTSAEHRESHPIKQAAAVQHQFIQIFPFTDHSGKVGRLLSNLILLRYDLLPVIIHSIDRQRYYEAFRAPAAAFRVLLMEAMENSLDNGIKYFRELARSYKAVN